MCDWARINHFLSNVFLKLLLSTQVIIDALRMFMNTTYIRACLTHIYIQNNKFIYKPQCLSKNSTGANTHKKETGKQHSEIKERHASDWVRRK